MKVARWAWVLAATAMLAAPVARGATAPALHGRAARVESAIPLIAPDIPRHGSGAIVFGGNAALRFAEDRVAGISNPDWASVVRVAGFAAARPSPRFLLDAAVAYERATDDLTVESARALFQVRPALGVHAGVLPLPLGRANLERDAPRGEFAERSLVATGMVGVPSSQLGAGVRGWSARRGRSLAWEVDIVTGYDEGLLNDSPDGTRIPRGRTGGGDNNGLPALAGRITLGPGPDTELGLAAIAGPYNRTTIDGVRVDRSRSMSLVVADGRTSVAGIGLAAELAAACVDVPETLEGVFAERQWGGAVEVWRVLLDPLRRSWRRAAVSAALRADAVDFDCATPGDSKSRLSASLNLRVRPLGVIRAGWRYEIRRDRFDNSMPAAGASLVLASYF